MLLNGVYGAPRQQIIHAIYRVDARVRGKYHIHAPASPLFGPIVEPDRRRKTQAGIRHRLLDTGRAFTTRQESLIATDNSNTRTPERQDLIDCRLPSAQIVTDDRRITWVQ